MPRTILSLVATPPLPPLDDEVLALGREVLATLGLSPEPEIRWLAPGIAADLAFEFAASDTPAGLAKSLRGRLAQARRPVDFAILPEAGRRKKLLLADMDSTLVTSETLDELAAHAGLKDEIAAITARAMRGELDFAGALRERVAMLEGLSSEAIAATRARLRLTPGARSLVRTLSRAGTRTVLISGGFVDFTAWAAEACGFDEHHGNRLEVREGRLTGRVVEPILGRDAKLERLRALAAEMGLEAEAIATIGDGANDIAMIEAAGLGVAFHGKPALKAAARHRIDHGDLRTLLFFQGFRAEEIVVPMDQPEPGEPDARTPGAVPQDAPGAS